MTDIAGLGDKSFNFLAGEGVKQAKKKYGITVRHHRLEVGQLLRAQHHELRPQGLRPRDRRRLPRGAGCRSGRQEVPGHQVRDRRRLHERQGAQGAQERRGPALQGVGGGLPRRLPRGPVREDERQGPQLGERDVDRGRHRDPAGRPLHRGLPGRRQGGRSRRQAAQRLLGRLHRPGQVPGPRPAADRTGLGHHLPGRRPVRPRRDQRRARQGLLGHRRRHRPVASRSAPSSCSSRPPRASTSPSSTSSARS